jgi:hypothetical protein
LGMYLQRAIHLDSLTTYLLCLFPKSGRCDDLPYLQLLKHFLYDYFLNLFYHSCCNFMKGPLIFLTLERIFSLYVPCLRRCLQVKCGCRKSIAVCFLGRFSLLQKNHEFAEGKFEFSEYITNSKNNYLCCKNIYSCSY